MHYRPAFDEGVRRKRREIAAIASHPGAPTFENTILALEQSGALLNQITAVFFAISAAHTNDDLQLLDEAFSAELADYVYLDDALFARVDAVYQARQHVGLDSESQRLVEIT